MSPRELRNQIDFFSAFRLCPLNKGNWFWFREITWRLLFPLCRPPNLYCSDSITKFIFIVKRWFRRMTSKSIFCQIFIQVKFSLPSSFPISRPPSNFYICQILKPATNQLHQLGLNQLQNQLRTRFDIQLLYIYISPFIITQILKSIKLQKLSNFRAQILNISNFDF